MARTKEKVFEAAGTAKPYVDRALHDEELRKSVQNAATAARSIYHELTGRQGVAGFAKVAADREIQDNLRKAVEELRYAAGRLQGKQAEQHRGGGSMLLLTALALGVLFNPVTGPRTRRWLKESLFGGGDEFGYEASTGNGTTS